MSTTETFTDLSGSGDIPFTASGLVYRARVDVSDLGLANIVDSDSTPRYYKIGYWVFTDNTFGLGTCPTSPIFFIDFQHTAYNGPGGSPWFDGGFGGFHYHLYFGVVATFTFQEQ